MKAVSLAVLGAILLAASPAVAKPPSKAEKTMIATVEGTRRGT